MFGVARFERRRPDVDVHDRDYRNTIIAPLGKLPTRCAFAVPAEPELKLGRRSDNDATVRPQTFGATVWSRRRSCVNPWRHSPNVRRPWKDSAGGGRNSRAVPAQLGRDCSPGCSRCQFLTPGCHPGLPIRPRVGTERMTSPARRVVALNQPSARFHVLTDNGHSVRRWQAGQLPSPP